VHQPVSFLFDLDGTLVDSLRDISAALNAGLRRLHRAGVSDEDVKRWVGDGLSMLCRRALPEADESSVTRLANLFMEHYSGHPLEHTRPYPNILKMLELLRARGCAMTVLSNKPDALTHAVIRGLKMEGFFACVQGSTSDDDRKPNPALALRIMSDIHVDPGNVFLVGDSAVDIETARRAGVRAVAVSWGFRDREELLRQGPDFMVDDPLDVIRLVDQMERNATDDNQGPFQSTRTASNTGPSAQQSA